MNIFFSEWFWQILTYGFLAVAFHVGRRPILVLTDCLKIVRVPTDKFLWLLFFVFEIKEYLTILFLLALSKYYLHPMTSGLSFILALLACLLMFFSIWYTDEERQVRRLRQKREEHGEELQARCDIGSCGRFAGCEDFCAAKTLQSIANDRKNCGVLYQIVDESEYEEEGQF